MGYADLKKNNKSSGDSNSATLILKAAKDVYQCLQDIV